MIGNPGNQPPSSGAFQKSHHQHKPTCGGKGLVMNNKRLISPLWFQDLRAEIKYFDKIYSHRSGCTYSSGNSKGFLQIAVSQNVSAGVLTTLTPCLAPYIVHAYILTSLRLHVPGLLEVDACPDWDVGRFELKWSTERPTSDN